MASRPYRSRILADTPLAEHWRVVARVYFSSGGLSSLTSMTTKRGYYYSVTPERLEQDARLLRAYSGVTLLLLEATRFHEPTLETLMPSAAQRQSLITHVRTQWTTTHAPSTHAA